MRTRCGRPKPAHPCTPQSWRRPNWPNAAWRGKPGDRNAKPTAGEETNSLLARSGGRSLRGDGANLLGPDLRLSSPALKPYLQAVEIEVDDRGGVERQYLTQ